MHTDWVRDAARLRYNRQLNNVTRCAGPLYKNNDADHWRRWTTMIEVGQLSHTCTCLGSRIREYYESDDAKPQLAIDVKRLNQSRKTMHLSAVCWVQTNYSRELFCGILDISRRHISVCDVNAEFRPSSCTYVWVPATRVYHCLQFFFNTSSLTFVWNKKAV